MCKLERFVELEADILRIAGETASASLKLDNEQYRRIALEEATYLLMEAKNKILQAKGLVSTIAKENYCN